MKQLELSFEVSSAKASDSRGEQSSEQFRQTLANCKSGLSINTSNFGSACGDHGITL